MKQRIRLVSWNVNGIRAVFKKGFEEWFNQERADVVALQETKIDQNSLTDQFTSLHGYESFWDHAEKKGYSGVSVYSRIKPISVSRGIGRQEFDREGRTLVIEYPEFTLLNVYFPNGKASEERLRFKMDFYEHFLRYLKKLRKSGKSLVICGDVNTAHHEIDLARPKENVDVSGFLPEERAWMDRFVKAGFVDSFRYKHPEKTDCYSWWSLRSAARQRNVGWRIDYFFVSEDIADCIVKAEIHDQVFGSDHCPVSLTLDFSRR